MVASATAESIAVQFRFVCSSPPPRMERGSSMIRVVAANPSPRVRVRHFLGAMCINPMLCPSLLRWPALGGFVFRRLSLAHLGFGGAQRGHARLPPAHESAGRV